jgi:hypothetical protein
MNDALTFHLSPSVARGGYDGLGYLVVISMTYPDSANEPPPAT